MLLHYLEKFKRFIFAANIECSECCPLALTKACLIYYPITLLTVVCSKSARTSTSRYFWAMSRTGFLYVPACSSRSCTQLCLGADWLTATNPVK